MSEASHERGRRRPAGMGIAARFTLGLGLLASVFAAIAAFLLLRGMEDLRAQAVDDALRDLAATTAEMQRAGAQVSGKWEARARPAANGVPVAVAESEVTLESGATERVRVFQVDAPGGGSPIFLYAPLEPAAGDVPRLLILVVIVCGGLVATVVILGAITARRLAAPLREMVEDVLAISRGRLDRRIRGEDAAGEVAHLAVAMERMVDDLLESQEAQEALAAKEAEAQNLRELRRNMQPMAVQPPAGWQVESRLLQAEGAGTGDFVDTLSDGGGGLALVVGAPAAEGMAGALLMATTRAYLRGALMGSSEPGVACDAANSSLNRDLARGLYCSAMVARVDPTDGTVALVSAGHQAPAVRWDAASGKMRKLQPNGIALGFDEGPVFRRSLETVQFQLQPGDALFLFSPRAFDCRTQSGKVLGETGVYQLARLAIESGMDAMVAKLERVLGGAPSVDLVFALVRRAGPSEGAEDAGPGEEA